ncbi:hypothetical protein H6G41_12130 [Tolypothrix sp. FACHB-123]|uniref:hypothetical protein n=1 Tax=Tolypothrix sp. FACHB-123 TaxID=2692868 RepID=UPI0016883132|nr:hypothetical protein [Tolypothrix sp. FACHB-123]MBD2355358.1 hypothetical protein [Tolypothrix sp. FACHB-123]
MLRCNLVTLPVVLAVLGSTIPATALPSEVFTAQLPEIQQNIPAGYGIRLPEEIRLSNVSDAYDGKLRNLLSQLTVRVFPSPRGLTIGLFNCEAATTPCLVGTFSADNPNAVTALYEFAKHKATGDPISLGKNMQGYFLDGNTQSPKLPFSSLMWKQDGLIHTVSFPAKERQNILFMGYSMANQPAIRRTVAKVKRPNSVFSLVK